MEAEAPCNSIETWDWQPGTKALVDLVAIRAAAKAVHEMLPSPDGESLAVLTVGEDGAQTATVNGSPWPVSFEKLWHLRYTPGGKLVGLAMNDYAWTVVEDGRPWEETFEYVWAPRFCPRTDRVAALIKRDNLYGVALAGKVWPQSYHMIRDYCLSPDGQHTAATVQVGPRKEADVAGFFAGMWSIAVDGQLWDSKFINVWQPVYNRDGSVLAAQVRTDIAEYTIAANGKPWPQSFGGVWEPIFRHQSGKIIAPVRMEGSWTLAEDGQAIWQGRYAQLWRPTLSPDGRRIAAVVSPAFGRWTVAIDDSPWPVDFGEMVLDPVFSPDGRRVAAVVKDADRWTVAVDGRPWPETFDMIWEPAFGPDGKHVIAKAERNGRYLLVLDGKPAAQEYTNLWPPRFSPNGQSVLLRVEDGGKYCRKVVPVAELAS